MRAGFDTLSCKYSIAGTRPSQGALDISGDTSLCKECKMGPEKKKPISLPSATRAKYAPTTLPPPSCFSCAKV